MNEPVAVVDYYDRCQIDYRLCWHLDTHMAMHYGLWEPGTRRLRDALINTNRQLAHAARIQPGQRVLDAGCGVGGSSIYLARTHGAVVTGISLSQKQVETCRRNARRAGAPDATFERRDFTATGLSPETFDVVWAIESVCHAREKAAFLREAYRLLKPGGRLALMDFFRRPDLRPEGAALVQRWADGWAVPEFSELKPFTASAAQEGFIDIVAEDLTAWVRPSARRLYLLSFPAFPTDRLLRLVRLRSPRQTLNTYAARWQYEALQQNCWHYVMVTAEKPQGEMNERA